MGKALLSLLSLDKGIEAQRDRVSWKDPAGVTGHSSKDSGPWVTLCLEGGRVGAAIQGFTEGFTVWLHLKKRGNWGKGRKENGKDENGCL